MSDLQELSDKATPGRWDASGWVYGTAVTESYGVWAGEPDVADIKAPVCKTSRYERGSADAAFIAALVNAYRSGALVAAAVGVADTTEAEMDKAEFSKPFRFGPEMPPGSVGGCCGLPVGCLIASKGCIHKVEKRAWQKEVGR